MFDADTIALMARAPSLEGVDLESLPQRLTDAYASIIAARMRLRQGAASRVTLPDEIAQTVGEMRRLAYAHEAFVSALPDRGDRAAAAFVAGAAHHVSLLAHRIAGTELQTSELGYQGISPEVSATLLFLVAEASADAAEMAKAIVIRGNDPVESALLAAVHNLANGRLGRLLAAAVPQGFLGTDQTTQGVRSLYYMLLHGIRVLAAQLLGRNVTQFAAPFATEPRSIFEQVRALCVQPLGDMFQQGDAARPTSIFPGPLHMASLLSAVSRDLVSSALATLTPPAGIDPERWSETMREIAQQRPYLWRNHRQAIEGGYLERGTSSVISFPTGAGKSTLAELKIAAALLGQEKVVFLAPTLALVDQTSKALRKTFPDARVRERYEESALDFDVEEMPAIYVMTPEACLTLLSFSRDVFADVGLLVFDECHLLHPRDTANSRRAVDAMLCVLNFTLVAPSADLLFLSAMLRNAEQIANWLQGLTQRTCLALELTWKPTRQVRGCVVYSTDQVEALQTRLRQVRANVEVKNAPATLKRELTAQPFGFFSLRQTWQTAHRDDYALLPLLENPVLLSTGTARDRSWYLTPNGNQVAASLAAATATQGLKTLVFTQTIPLANAAFKKLTHALGVSGFVLTEGERALYDAAREEMGAPAHLYLEVGEHHAVTSSSAPHHGLLLPVERSLHESLFRRPDGINVLVATSTLAQGMNLPSEVVIIAGDSRFDPEADRLQQLEAHELLNAAGRAGRAGDGSYGFVLVVPSKVVHFDDATNRIQRHWGVLQAIFSQSDQCIEIEDPLTPLLDQIHLAAGPLTPMALYLIRRLPMGGPEEDQETDFVARNILARSLGAFFARLRNDEPWIESRVEAVLAARRADPEAGEALTWADRLASAAGVPVGVIGDLSNWLDGQPIGENATVTDWRDAIFDWVEQRPALITSLLRRETLEGLLGTPYRRLEDDEARAAFALPILRRLLNDWMAGVSLADLERSFGTPEQKLGKCEAAREFVLRIVPELAYVFGLPSQVLRARETEGDTIETSPLSLRSLGACVREGLDRNEKLALRFIRRATLSRVAIHREFVELSGLIDRALEDESFQQLTERVRRAIRIFELREDEL